MVCLREQLIRVAMEPPMDFDTELRPLNSLVTNSIGNRAVEVCDKI